MKNTFIYLVFALLFLVFGCKQSGEKAVISPEKIQKEIEKGNFNRAEKMIYHYIMRNDLSDLEKYEWNYELDLMKRIKQDFSQTEEELTGYLKKYYPDIYGKLMSARRKLMYESMIANIRKGKKEGLYRRDLDEKIISKLHLLRIENVQSSEIFAEEEKHSSAFFREIFIYHIHGLATDKGRKILLDNADKLALLKEH